MDRLLRLILIACCIFSYSSLFAQDINWEKMEFFGGHIPKLTLDRQSGELYAGSNSSGLFKWDNDGEMWNQIGMPESQIHMVHVSSGGIIWFGIEGKLFSSSNGGEEWMEVEAGLFIPTAMNSVDADHLYIGGYSGANYIIRYSENGGESWNTQLTLSRFEQISDIEFDSDGNVYVGALGGGGVHMSSDNGDNWTEIYDGNVYDVLVLDEAILVGTDYNLKRSTDGGDNWDQVGPNIRFASMDIDSDGNIYGVDGGVVRGSQNIQFSDDAGENWSTISTGLDASCQPLNIVINRENDVISIGTTLFGVYQGDDPENLVQINNQLSAQVVQQVAVTDEGHFIVAAMHENFGTTVWRSEDGSNWTKNSEPENGFNPVSEIVITDDGTIICSTAGSYVYRSTNGGDTFTQVQTSHPNVMDVAISPDGDLYAGMAGFTVQHSDDDGASWTPTENTAVWIKSLITNAAGDVYAGSSQGSGVYLSSDMGDSWEQINDGLGGGVINELAYHQASGTVIAGRVNDGFFRYSEQENSWTAINDGLPHGDFGFLSTHGQRILITENGVAFAGILHTVGQGVVEYGIYRSHDLGGNWEDVSFNMEHKVINDLGITDDGRLVVATNGCIYLSENSVLSVEQSNELVPDQFAMSVFPNPFNSTATVHFGLPGASEVNVSVYDAAGRLVETLLNGYQIAGQHSATWNAEGVPTGVYIVRLESNEFTAAHKISLLR